MSFMIKLGLRMKFNKLVQKVSSDAAKFITRTLPENDDIDLTDEHEVLKINSTKMLQ